MEEIRHFIIHAFFFGKAGETVLIVDGDVIVVREELSDGAELSDHPENAL